VFLKLLAFLALKMILEPIFCFLGARWLKNLVGFYNPPEMRKRDWKIAKLAV
jgi:hypothetical protein